MTLTTRSTVAKEEGGRDVEEAVDGSLAESFDDSAAEVAALMSSAQGGWAEG